MHWSARNNKPVEFGASLVKQKRQNSLGETVWSRKWRKLHKVKWERCPKFALSSRSGPIISISISGPIFIFIQSASVLSRLSVLCLCTNTLVQTVCGEETQRKICKFAPFHPLFHPKLSQFLTRPLFCSSLFLLLLFSPKTRAGQWEANAANCSQLLKLVAGAKSAKTPKGGRKATERPLLTLRFGTFSSRLFWWAARTTSKWGRRSDQSVWGSFVARTELLGGRLALGEQNFASSAKAPSSVCERQSSSTDARQLDETDARKCRDCSF